MTLPARRKVPDQVERLHAAYRGGTGSVKQWRLYAAIGKVEEFTTLVGWAEGTEEQLRSALDGWDCKVIVRFGQIHVNGPALRSLPPGFSPPALPVGKLGNSA